MVGEETAPPPTEIVPPSVQANDIVALLEARLKNYETAETNAKTIRETSRARRYNRAIKTLKDLLRQAKAGKAVSEDEIPPEVATNIHKPTEVPSEPQVTAPVRPAPAVPTETPPEETVPSEQNQELLQMLNKRRDEYKMAALKAKKLNDKTTAINYIKVAKQFEAVISAVESGQPLDLSLMPGPPGEPSEKTQEGETQKESDHPQPPEKEIVEGIVLFISLFCQYIIGPFFTFYALVA